jgi:uncharacterized protein
MIASPCTGVCTMNTAGTTCLGCLRTRDEIACWGSTSDSHRLQILANIQRREASGEPRVAPKASGA